MTTHSIPDEAVEAAAKAHVGPGDTAWDDLTPMVRRMRIQKMRAALEAAAPHMLAGVESIAAPDPTRYVQACATCGGSISWDSGRGGWYHLGGLRAHAAKFLQTAIPATRG